MWLQFKSFPKHSNRFQRRSRLRVLLCSSLGLSGSGRAGSAVPPLHRRSGCSASATLCHRPNPSSELFRRHRCHSGFSSTLLTEISILDYAS